MRIVIIASAALAVAAPAFAQDAAPFTGARIGATVGYDKTHGSDGVTYGGAFGYDYAVTPNITLGAEATLEDSTTKFGGVHASRDAAVSARIGYVLTPKVLGFAKVGYDTTRVEVNGAACAAAGSAMVAKAASSQPFKCFLMAARPYRAGSARARSSIRPTARPCTCTRVAASRGDAAASP